MSGETILIVDDEPDILSIGKMSLERVGGYTVETVSSGEDCLKRARADKPDAILMDLMMPGMDGAETFQKLRDDSETRSIPVIMLTAKVQQSERDRLLEMGADGVLQKPFDPMQLPSQLKSALGWS